MEIPPISRRKGRPLGVTFRLRGGSNVRPRAEPSGRSGMSTVESPTELQAIHLTHSPTSRRYSARGTGFRATPPSTPHRRSAQSTPPLWRRALRPKARTPSTPRAAERSTRAVTIAVRRRGGGSGTLRNAANELTNSSTMTSPACSHRGTSHSPNRNIEVLLPGVVNRPSLVNGLATMRNSRIPVRARHAMNVRPRTSRRTGRRAGQHGGTGQNADASKSPSQRSVAASVG